MVTYKLELLDQTFGALKASYNTHILLYINKLYKFNYKLIIITIP